MSCYRFDLHRKHLLYLHGRLAPTALKKVEDHLLDCSSCRTRVEKLAATEKRLKDLPHRSAPNHIWPMLRTGLPEPAPVVSSAPVWQKIAIVTLFGLLSGLVGAATYVKLTGHDNFLEWGIHTSEYKPVSIPHMASTTEPHVVTEGYVTESKIEEEDGDTVFKIVESPNSSGPFVICEVIDPLNLPIPPVGSRVRVYGVSRYDGQENHQWHEVHPVLNIEVLKN